MAGSLTGQQTANRVERRFVVVTRRLGIGRSAGARRLPAPVQTRGHSSRNRGTMLRIACKNKDLAQKLADSIPFVISCQLDKLVKDINERNSRIPYVLTEKAVKS